MNQKKLIIIVGSGLIIILLVILLIIRLLQSKTPGSSPEARNPAASITLIPPGRVSSEPRENGLPLLSPSPQIRATNPAKGQDEVAVTTKNLTVQLANSTVSSASEVNIFIDPPTQFSYRLVDGTVRITFLKNLEPGTIYSYSVSTNGSAPFVASFTTAGPTKAPLPGIEPPDYFKNRDENDRKNYPDIFLSNLTPFENDTFRIDSEFTETPKEGFTFTVQKKKQLSESDLKAAVSQWIITQGLTNEQVQSLKITYE